MPLNVYAGNRMETLLIELQRVVARPLPSPLDREIIVVQSKGMQRWLAMELSRRFGVWANCDYPFLNEMVDRLFRLVLPEEPDTAPFAPELLVWRLMGLIPPRLPDPAFDEIRHYLADDGDAVKLFQLAEKIADTFDQYTLFRPDLLTAWEKGRDGGWQGELWRALVGESGPRHRAALFNRFRDAVALLPADAGLPSRISLIGIPTLPPFHTDLLARISGRIEVNLFLLNPCRAYWGDIVSGQERVRLVRKGADGESLEAGNPLLASLGRAGRLFFEDLLSRYDTDLRDRYTEASAGSLLHAIQNDILDLTDRGRQEPARIGADDRSLQIHSCHGPLREVEVLHDTLLDLLHRDHTISPRDILVMTPDIDAYAPYIAAVFGGCQGTERFIPFSVADRSIRAEGHVARLLMSILDLCGSRFAAGSVLELLDAAPVGERFGLRDDDLDLIRRWVNETRIRWGIDAGDRVRRGLPAYGDNSWRAGLDRLLAGYALPQEADRLYDGILPFDGLEGDAARLLGRFLEFCDLLFATVKLLEEPRTLADWASVLRETAERFVDRDGEYQDELMDVTDVVRGLGTAGDEAGYGASVPVELVRRWLGERLDCEVKGLGFLTGRVTFCRMLPMRSIPFRVVVLLGMNDGAFPRENRPPGFDLMAREPRPGDRSLRDEDRYLFLEALLSARDVLVISYTGQGIRDNAELPPSVLVSELLDYAAAGFLPHEVPSAAPHNGLPPMIERLVTRHRLQAFSPAYFTTGSGLASYARENCEALRQRAAAGARQPFLAKPLPDPPAEQKQVALHDLQRFYANPARQFLGQRLKMRLPDTAELPDEREPFAVAGLDAYTIRQELTAACLDGADPRVLLPFFCSQGLLPPARHGEMVFDLLCDEAAAFAADVRAVTGGTAPLEPREIDLEIGGFRLTGRLDGVWPAGPVRYRAAGMKGKDRIRAWIDHLVACAVADDGTSMRTTLCMRGRSAAWRRVDDPALHLETLLSYWWKGQNEPLRFFPDSALAYADGGWDLDRATKTWDGGFGRDGEGADPSYRRCFGEEYPFDDRFCAIARELLAPLLSHQEKG